MLIISRYYNTWERRSLWMMRDEDLRDRMSHGNVDEICVVRRGCHYESGILTTPAGTRYRVYEDWSISKLDNNGLTDQMRREVRAQTRGF